MKKILSVVFALIFTLSLSACGAKPAAPADYTIAIVQQLDHASLDEIRTAIVQRLTELAAQKGITLAIVEKNGQNDASLLNQIGAGLVSDKVDAIIPIATLAAQCMQNATEGTDIPVVYAAVSMPEQAALFAPNVTGTSDALDTALLLDLMFATNKPIETVGLLYSLSEDNSRLPIAEAKQYLAAKGVAVVEKTGNTTDEILTAVDSMLDLVDAVFTPTDNVVMAAELAVAERLTAAGIPHYAGADSFVQKGAFASCGVDYTQCGAKTAEMALEILLEGASLPPHTLAGGIVTVNTDTAAALGLSYDSFAGMAQTLVTTTTSVG